MKIREHIPSNRIVFVPTVGEQWVAEGFLLACIIIPAFSTSYLISYRIFGPIALLLLLYILGELLSHKVIIDKFTDSIILTKRYFLLIAKQSVIPFSTVVNVEVVHTKRYEPMTIAGYVDAYVLRINYHSRQDLQTLKIDRADNEDPMLKLAADIRSIIGEEALKKAEKEKAEWEELGLEKRRRLGDISGNSIADYNKAIELNPNDADAYYNRGCAYDEMGEYGKAISDYNGAIALNKNHALAYYRRACAYGGIGEVSKAVSDLEKCIELSTNPELTEAGQQALRKAKKSP